MTSMTDNTRHLDIRVSIAGIQPQIWRKLRLPASLSLAATHFAIQYTMNWQSRHLWSFRRNDRRFSIPRPDLDLRPPPQDARTTSLAELLDSEHPRLFYLYDYGDNWKLRLELQSETTGPDSPAETALVDGARAGPPEDCGGVPGYHQIIEGLESGDLSEHRRTWLGDWHPQNFDPDSISLPDAETLESKAREYADAVGAPPVDDYDPEPHPEADMMMDEHPGSASQTDSLVETLKTLLKREVPDNLPGNLDPQTLRDELDSLGDSVDRIPFHEISQATKPPADEPLKVFPRSHRLRDCLDRLPVDQLDTIFENIGFEQRPSRRGERAQLIVGRLATEQHVHNRLDDSAAADHKPLLEELAESDELTAAYRLLESGILDPDATDDQQDWMRFFSDHPVSGLRRHGLVHIGVRNTGDRSFVYVGIAAELREPILTWLAACCA